MRYQQRPWRSDPLSKSFSHAKFYGATTIPTTLGRPRRALEDQRNTLRCAPYAAAVNGGYIHGFRFSPEWQTDKIKRIQGYSVDLYGSEPNAAMKSQVYSYNGGYLLDTQWDYLRAELLDSNASANGDAAYLKVTAHDGIDTFDAIREALTLSYNPTTRLGACVQAFGRFYSEWEHADIIPTSYLSFAGWHSYLFIDFQVENGIQYLVAQNSYATRSGKDGFHRFPREVVNREFTLSGTTLKIPKTLTADQIALAKQQTPFGAIERQIILIWQLITNLFG